MRRSRPKLLRKDQSTKHSLFGVSKEVFEYLNSKRSIVDYSLDDTLRRLLCLPPREFVPPDAGYYKRRDRYLATKVKQYQQQAKFMLITKQLEEE